MKHTTNHNKAHRVTVRDEMEANILKGEGYRVTRYRNNGRIDMVRR